jgi:Flp pilus assembly protein TadD
MTLRQPQQAAEAYAAAQARAPSGTLAVRLAGALQAAGKPEDATRGLAAWVAANPGDAVALNLLAQFDLVAGRLPQAEQRLRQVVTLAPENAVALNNLAWVLGEQGEAKLAEARAFAERAYYLSPNVETADTLGWILARSGETRLAVEMLRRAIGPGSQPGARYHLAHALHQAGERAEALEVLTPALAEGTTFTERAAAERLRATLTSPPAR